MRHHHSRRRAESGYSLIEMLVVIAIIGVVSLVTVPQFIAYQRSNLLKTSMRQVMNDLRLVRQQAVALRTDARLRFQNNERVYTLERRAPDGTWVGITPASTTPTVRSMDETCTLTSPDGLGTTTVDGETFNTIVFRQDGSAQITGQEGKGRFVVRTSHALTRTSYTIEVHVPGFVRAL